MSFPNIFEDWVKSKNPETGALDSVPISVDHTRRIIDLETRIAALEAALDKLTGDK